MSLKLERMSWQPKTMPWGIELDEATLRFSGCTEGSVAKECIGMHGMIGLELDSINSSRVCTLEDAEKAFSKAYPTNHLKKKEKEGFAKMS